MRILFVHCNFPAQFRYLAAQLAKDPNNEVKFLAQNQEWTATPIEGVHLERYSLGRDPQGALCHPYLRRYEAAVLHGQAALRQALQLRQQGFLADLIIGHSGFGNTLYLKEVWPKARYLGYFEWFYRTSGSDVNFGEVTPPSPDTSLRVHTYNSPIVMDLAIVDRGLCPTNWQASQFPDSLRSRLSVVFDGIDTEQLQPAPERKKEALTIRDLTIGADIPLVTYVTRGFEPYRGWPQVAEGLALLLQRNPRVQVLLVGSDEIAYGVPRNDGCSWYNWAMEKWPMDQSRVHRLPALQYNEYLQVLQRSWVHVYYTVPFILSWSLMESLASGCAVVASDTPPVQEVITSGKEGLLVPFFEPEALAAQVDALLADHGERQRLATAAREKIIEGGYSRKDCLQRQLALINELMAS